MRKNQKGITIVSLAITIAVILIISSIGISTGMSLINTARFQELTTNMLLIQAKAKAEAEKHNFDAESIVLTGVKIESDSVEQLEDSELLYKLSQDDLTNWGLRNVRLKEGEYFVVDYDINNNGEVYFLPNGFKYKSSLTSETKIYYKLSEMMEVNINEEI